MTQIGPNSSNDPMKSVKNRLKGKRKLEKKGTFNVACKTKR